MKNIALFASGNGTNVQRIAEYFADSKDVSIKLIVCNKATAYVLERAKKLQIDSLLVDKATFYESDKIVKKLQQLDIDLIVLAGFLWLIPENLIAAFPQKIINIHPALLPKYGGKGMYGMHVHEAVIANREAFSGISIHYVNQNYDEGDIIFQAKCAISNEDTAENVAQKVHALEYAHYPEIIEKVVVEKKQKAEGRRQSQVAKFLPFGGFYSIILLLLSLYSCKEKPISPRESYLTFVFEHRIDNETIVLDTYYANAANNRYCLQEIKYFISSVCLYKHDGKKVDIQHNEGIHYVDLAYKNTLTWEIAQQIPEGEYDSIGFTFGLNQIDNQSFRFKNPPESNMAWPEVLGGGYHYMMLNGWFYRGDTVLAPLNIHLGRGQIYQGTTPNVDSIIGFVDNYFSVCLPVKSFSIKRDETKTVKIVMNIENWFKTPYLYDFNYWGGHIMQNQSAMQTLKENGKNVFSVMISD